MELFFEHWNAVLDNVERKMPNADKFETMSYETAKAQGLIPDSTEQKARASDLQRFASGLKERLRTINPENLASEEGGRMGSSMTGWMSGDMVVDWELLDKEIDQFAAEFVAKNES